MLTEKQLLDCRTALSKYAYSLTHNQDARDDLVQNTLCRAWAKRHLFEGNDATPWLLVIAHNQHVNDVRKAARENGKASEDVQITPEAQSSHVFALEVKDAIERLPLGQQQVLIFAGINGEEYADAAKAFGIPLGTIRSRLFRGRDTLRRKFA